MNKIIYGLCLVLLLSGNIRSENLNNANVDVLAKSTYSWDGGSLPGYSAGQPEVTILKITIPPGSQLPLHKHPIINAGVLIKGELTVITEDKKILHLKEGQSIVEVVNKWHYGRNEGANPAEIIVFYAGIQDKPITTKKQ